MKFQKQRSQSNWQSETVLLLLAALCFLCSLYVAVKYAYQVPLDAYSFRQTQTALSAYWLVKNGFSFFYETPVAGMPWGMPFEFPIYQGVVAFIAKTTGISLNAIARLVSYLFLVLCLIPIHSITKKLECQKSVFYIFIALFFSSPAYLYWGRTFMIETTALFFSIVGIKYFVDIVKSGADYKNQFLFAFFMSLSLLQKATTGLPVLVILGCSYTFLILNDAKSLKNIRLNKENVSTIISFVIPLLLCILWTLYTDVVKSENELGVHLTSSALKDWNWGTLKDRISSGLYVDVIWNRILKRNLAGVVGILIILVSLCSHVRCQKKIIIILSLLFAFLPLFLFPHLHIVHDYYQAANIVFLIYAVAVSLGSIIINKQYGKVVVCILMLIMVGSNYYYFSTVYLGVVRVVFNSENSRDYAVSEVLNKKLTQDQYFIAFGNDWSSSLAYLSERKSFTVPMFFKQYSKISTHPEYFIKEERLGAVVLCPPLKYPTVDSMIEWSSTHRNWKIEEVSGCYILTPETALPTSAKIVPTKCKGNIDFAGEKLFGQSKMLSVKGWTSLSESNEKNQTPDKVYITLTKNQNIPLYFEALQVRRSDIKKQALLNEGFERLIKIQTLSGKYRVGIVRVNQGNFEACQFQKEVGI